MTKKITLPIFIAIYLVSLAAGFGFAGMRQTAKVDVSSSNNGQSAWIMVRVDDMTIEQPRLVSVWAMFMTFSSGPQVFFKPLYSSEAETNRYPNLGRVFSVSADRTISNDFMKELNRLVSYQSGVVILDDAGFKSFTSWFTEPALSFEMRPMVPPTGLKPAGAVETRTYNQICNSLETPTRPSLANLPWNDLFPNHLLAYPSIQGLTNVWDRLLRSNLEAHCEVIPVQ